MTVQGIPESIVSILFNNAKAYSEIKKQIKSSYDNSPNKEKQGALEYIQKVINEVSNLETSNFSSGKTLTDKDLNKFAFIHPIKNHVITSKFGPRSGKNHDGIDYGHPTNTSIMAAESGNVIATGYTQGYKGYGEVVVIQHSKSITTLYAHLNPGTIKVKKGQYVKRGTIIGGVGSTGNSSGPHLHFEIRINGKAIDPIKYLGVNNSTSSTNIISVDNLIIHHSAGGSHQSFEDIKNFHKLNNGWNDIGYHMIIEADGKIVRGRADDIQGAQALGANEYSLGVCLIGNFMKSSPPKAQIDSLVKVLTDWCKKYNLPVTKIIGHKNVAKLYNRADVSTACPGDILYGLIPEIRKRVKAKL